VNLYQEKNPEDAPVKITHYPTPGKTLLGTAPAGGMVRGLWLASSGDLYAVANGSVYYVSPSWAFTLLGTIFEQATPVSMSDNGTTLVLVDGTPNGYQIDLTTRVMTPISAATNSPPSGSEAVYAFYGGNRVEFLDTFLVLNQPSSPSFYCTYSNEVVFDSTYFADKRGFSDNLVTIAIVQREIWLIGEVTTEIWFDAGGTAFPFQILPGPFIEHGCVALYSIAKAGGALFWLSQDFQGTTIVLRGFGYAAVRISTHAIEQELSTYSSVVDAVGFTYQQQGHVFYVLTFPSADRTWVYDESCALWHERGWFDSNGVQHRDRANCAVFAYGVNVCGDWQNGNLYKFDLNNYTDNGQPIPRIRSFPHILDDGKRVFYQRFVADMQVGTAVNTFNNPQFLPDTLTTDTTNLVLTTDGPNPTPLSVDGGVTVAQYFNPPAGTEIRLRWSDTRGASWGQYVVRGLGATGEFLTQPQWRRLGMARDRVFELEWSAPLPTALNGAFIDMQVAGT